MPSIKAQNLKPLSQKKHVSNAELKYSLFQSAFNLCANLITFCVATYHIAFCADKHTRGLLLFCSTTRECHNTCNTTNNKKQSHHISLFIKSHSYKQKIIQTYHIKKKTKKQNLCNTITRIKRQHSLNIYAKLSNKPYSNDTLA